MGYVTQNSRRPWLIADFETTARDDIDQFADDMRVDRRLVDPEKIAAAKAKRIEMAATDIDFAQIACVGLWSSTDDGPTVLCGLPEREMVGAFWQAYEAVTSDGGQVVGFNIGTYDLPLAITRAQILDVPYTRVDLYRYAKGGPVLDLLRILTHDWAVDKDKWKKLDVYARLRGIDIPDPTTGADMPALIAAGDWEAVRAHNLADLRRTQALAQRLGYIGPPAVPEARPLLDALEDVL
jgi:hypothetical protein